MKLHTKQPNETLDYDVDCSRRIDSEDAITNVSASISGPDSALLLDRSTYYDDTVAKIYVSGGTNNATYKVTMLITTRNGRIIETEFLIHVKDL